MTDMFNCLIFFVKKKKRARNLLVKELNNEEKQINYGKMNILVLGFDYVEYNE